MMTGAKILKVEVHHRAMPKSYERRELKSYNSKPRLYFHHVGENVFDQLISRHFRPQQLYRHFLPEVFRQVQLPEGTTAKWSQNAGCSMCPCSPGFIIETTMAGHFDVWVDFTVEGEKTPTQMMEEAKTEAAEAAVHATFESPLA